MTDDEREKFDAIRMNLELTGHDLESMREKLENMGEKIETLRFACEENRLACEELRKTAESHERQFVDLRETVNVIKEGTLALLISPKAHDRRLDKLELVGRT